MGGVDAALRRSKLGATVDTPGIWVASSFSKQLGTSISPGHSGGLQGQCKMNKSLVVEREAGGQAEHVLRRWRGTGDVEVGRKQGAWTLCWPGGAVFVKLGQSLTV